MLRYAGTLIGFSSRHYMREAIVPARSLFRSVQPPRLTVT